jgi:hypothetical protein
VWGTDTATWTWRFSPAIIAEGPGLPRWRVADILVVGFCFVLFWCLFVFFDCSYCALGRIFKQLHLMKEFISGYLQQILKMFDFGILESM